MSQITPQPSPNTPPPQNSPPSLPGLRSPVVAPPRSAESKEAVKRERQTGCLIGVVTLLVVVIFASAGYLTISFVTSRLSSYGTGATPTPAPTMTTPINATLTYAGDIITIVDVRQSASFPDDASIVSAPGEVRLDIIDRNATANPTGGFSYKDVAHIILPTSKSISPINAENLFSPGSTAPRTNWLDFPVPTNTNVGELLLRLGRVGEAQMDVLLRPNVDLSRYQSKTIKPHETLHYRGLNWTIKSADLSWSTGNQQASAGMLYLAITLMTNNSTSQDFTAFPGDYMRLKVGGTTLTPTVGTTFPPVISAKTTGSTGTVDFLVPQDATSYTFILLANPTSQAPQASANFQIH
jgi:hypothetical protein